MLYHDLMNGYFINKETYCIEHNINERTFERDIAEVRNFLDEIFSQREVSYDKQNGVYFLSGRITKPLDKMEAIAIVKTLLESGTLIKEEMNGLIDKIMQSVRPNVLNDVNCFLKKDLDMYKSKNTAPILKILMDLFQVINIGYDIEFIDFENRSRIISPIRILIEDSKFVLIATEKGLLSDYIKIDLEELLSFKVLNTTKAKRLQQKYYSEREGEENGN